MCQRPRCGGLIDKVTSTRVLHGISQRLFQGLYVEQSKHDRFGADLHTLSLNASMYCTHQNPPRHMIDAAVELLGTFEHVFERDADTGTLRLGSMPVRICVVASYLSGAWIVNFYTMKLTMPSKTSSAVAFTRFPRTLDPSVRIRFLAAI